MNHLKIQCNGDSVKFDPTIKQTLSPIISRSFRRTIDDRLVSLNARREMKYKLLIEGQNLIPLDLINTWNEKNVFVDCIQRFRETQSIVCREGSITLSKYPVPSSVIVSCRGMNGPEQQNYRVSGQHLIVDSSRTDPTNSYEIIYRPRLEMRLIDFKWITKAYEKEVSWSLLLEEI